METEIFPTKSYSEIKKGIPCKYAESDGWGIRWRK